MAPPTAWSFAGYTFPWNSQPEGGGGAGEWGYDEKVVIHAPLNNNTDVITSFGFKSARRTINGRGSKAFRDALRALQLARTVGLLVDADGGSWNARIEKLTFKELFPGGRYEYSIDFVAR